MATFEAYMNSQPRKLLSKASNNGTNTNPPHPLPNDSGNWTGCREGEGQLSGTFRDLSACFLTTLRGYPVSPEDLRALTLEDVKSAYKPLWDNLGLSSLKDQELANIIMHIKLHYGNIWIVQKSLNDLGASPSLSVDGVAGAKTKEALLDIGNKKPIQLYNKIRENLKESYSQNEYYGEAFLKIIQDYFPPREGGALSVSGTLGKLKWWQISLIVLGVLILGIIIFKLIRK